SGITSALNVNAAATDSLVLNDQAYGGPHTFTITDTTIAWGGPLLSYSGLGSVRISGGSGGNTFYVLASSPTAALTIVGGGNGATLVGSNSGNVFTLSAANSGSLSGTAYGTGVSFSQVSNLTAGPGGDWFRFADGATLAGSITGSGVDTLDYTAYSA